MAHRRIGQEVLRFGTKAERRNSLDELDVLIDWSLADSVLALLYPAAGATSKLMRKGHRHLPAERREAHNRPRRPIRARIEKIFATWKRSDRFRSM